MTEIIELRNNSQNTNILNNGEFICTFTPKTLNYGDSLFIKSALIDTLVQNTSQNIYIKQDTVLTFKWMITDYDHNFYGTDFNDLKIYNFPKTVADFNHYIGIDSTQPNTPVIVYTLQKTLPKGNYTYTSLAQTITRLLVEVNELEYPEDINIGNSPFFRPTYSFGNYQDPHENMTRTKMFFARLDLNTGAIARGTGTYNYKTSSEGNLSYPLIMLGAEQISLTYNDNDNNRFQWSYLHTPLYNINTQPADFKPVIGQAYIQYPAQGPFPPYLGQKFISRTTGIIWNDLQPASFWESLGFNLDEICLRLNEDNTQFTNFNYKKQFTYNLTTISDLLDANRNTLFNITESTPGPIYRFSDDTNPVSAQQFDIADPSPYFLIELESNYCASDYEDQGKISKSIAAVVAKGYLNQNYVISYQDDSVVYVHQSEIPAVISNFKVRILDCNTKQLSENVGPNNYIIVAISRNTLPPLQEKK